MRSYNLICRISRKSHVRERRISSSRYERKMKKSKTWEICSKKNLPYSSRNLNSRKFQTNNSKLSLMNQGKTMIKCWDLLRIEQKSHKKEKNVHLNKLRILRNSTSTRLMTCSKNSMIQEPLLKLSWIS
jgi:hypothetical protein